MFIKKNRGFTLVEILVVIAIIGILASIVLVSMGGARAKARDAKRQSDIRQIVAAMEMYYNDGEVYLTSATAPTAIGTYLDGVPQDPVTSNGAYDWLDNSADDQRFCIYATLESTSGCASSTVKYFMGSHRGTKEACQAAAPADLDCW